MDPHANPGAAPRYRAAIWTLLFLSPVIAEVLSGATRASVIFVLIPEVMVWGVGALLSRELVRRWGGAGLSLLCMGLALSIAEEFIIQQTSLAPLPFGGSNASYGRLGGVNLVYFLFMLGFESVWVVLVPVQVAELIFPRFRNQPWLRTRGMVACCLVFVAGSFIAWYSWTQEALPKKLHVPPYHPPALTLALGLAAIGALVLLAHVLRGIGHANPDDARGTAPAWMAGVAALVLGAPWFELIAQMFVPHPIEPFWLALGAGMAWAAVALVLFAWWPSRGGWNDTHRWFAALGATLACIGMPYIGASTWPRIDIAGKMCFDAAVLALFAVLARRVFQSPHGRPLEPANE